MPIKNIHIYKEINREIEQTNWHQLFDGKGVEECFELLNSKYIALIEKYIPLRSLDPKKLDTRDRIKWFNQKIKEAT